MSSDLHNRLPSRETLESWSYDDFQGWLAEQDEAVQQAFVDAEASPLVFETYDSQFYSPPSFSDFQRIVEYSNIDHLLFQTEDEVTQQTTSASRKHADSAEAFTSSWSLPVSESSTDSEVDVIEVQRNEVRSRFDELDPFLYQLTDADLAPILEDSELFYDYVEHHGLQEAFMDDQGGLIFIPVSAQQLSTILMEVFPVEMGIVPYDEGYSLTVDAKAELLANESAWASVDERFRILLDEELPGFIQFDAATKTKIFDAYTLNQDKFDLETFRAELHSFSTELEELHFLETQYGAEVSDKRPVMAMVIHGLLNGDVGLLREIESSVVLQAQIATLESLESMQRAIKGGQMSESVSDGLGVADDIHQLETGNVSKFNPMGEDTTQEIAGLFDSIDEWQSDYATLFGKSQALAGDIVQLKKKVYEKIYRNLLQTSADPLVIHDFLVSIGTQPDAIPDSMRADVEAAIETEVAQYEIGSYEYYYYSGFVDEARGKAFAEYESTILPGQLVEDFEAIQQEGWENFYDPRVGSMNLFAQSYQTKITPDIVYQALDQGWTPILAITGRRDSVEGWRFVKKTESGEYTIQIWDNQGKVLSTQQFTQDEVSRVSAQDKSDEIARLRQSLEMDPDLAALREMSTDLAARLAPLQKLFSDSLNPDINKSEEFVMQLKLEIYEFQAYYRSVEQQYKQHFDQAGDALEFLKRYYWLLPEEEFAPFESMMKQMEAFSPQNIDDFIEQSTSKAYHADTLVEWAQRDGVVIVGAVIGSLVATALLVPSGGTSSLAYVAAVGALGGTIGTQAGMEFSGQVFDTELKSAHHRLLTGEMTFLEFEAELGTQFLTQFAFQYGAARLFQGYQGQISKMLVSQDPKIVKFAQSIQKLESFRDAGKTSTLGHLAELSPRYGQFLAEFVEETGEEFMEEVVTDAAGPAGRLVMFWNLRSTKGIPGVTVFSQNINSAGNQLTVQFNYDATETSSTMERLREKHQDALASGQASLELDENTGDIVLTLTSENSDKKLVQRYSRSLVPVEIRAHASLVSSDVDVDTYLEKEAGVKVDYRASEPYLYLKSGANPETAIQKIQSLGFSLNGLDLMGQPPSMTFFSLEGGMSFSIELTASAAKALEQSSMIDHSRSVSSQQDVSENVSENTPENLVETSMPSSVLAEGDFSIPTPANNNLHFNPLLQSPEIQARLSAMADGRLGDEVEIYAVIDDATGEVIQYNFTSGQSESMGEVLLSVSDDGSVVDEEYTSNPQNPDFGLQEGQSLQYMGHMHPAGDGYSVVPSVEDFNKFFYESVNEYYIMRQDANTGEISWSRIYLDDAGDVQVQFSDSSLDTPELQAELLVDIQTAHEEFFGQGVRRAAASRERTATNIKFQTDKDVKAAFESRLKLPLQDGKIHIDSNGYAVILLNDEVYSHVEGMSSNYGVSLHHTGTHHEGTIDGKRVMILNQNSPIAFLYQEYGQFTSQLRTDSEVKPGWQGTYPSHSSKAQEYHEQSIGFGRKTFEAVHEKYGSIPSELYQRVVAASIEFGVTPQQLDALIGGAERAQRYGLTESSAQLESMIVLFQCVQQSYPGISGIDFVEELAIANEPNKFGVGANMVLYSRSIDALAKRVDQGGLKSSEALQIFFNTIHNAGDNQYNILPLFRFVAENSSTDNLQVNLKTVSDLALMDSFSGDVNLPTVQDDYTGSITGLMKRDWIESMGWDAEVVDSHLGLYAAILDHNPKQARDALALLDQAYRDDDSGFSVQQILTPELKQKFIAYLESKRGENLKVNELNAFYPVGFSSAADVSASDESGIQPLKASGQMSGDGLETATDRIDSGYYDQDSNSGVPRAKLGEQGLQAMPLENERQYYFEEFEMVREVDGGYHMILRNERGEGELRFVTREQYLEMQTVEPVVTEEVQAAEETMYLSGPIELSVENLEALETKGYNVGTTAYRDAIKIADHLAARGLLAYDGLNDFFASLPTETDYLQVKKRFGNNVNTLMHEIETRCELQNQLAQERVSSGFSLEQAMHQARTLVPDVFSVYVPGKSRIVSMDDVKLVSDYFRTLDASSNPDLTRIVGENYRGLTIFDTSTSNVSATYNPEQSLESWFVSQANGVRTVDHHGPYGKAPDGSVDTRNSTMKLLDIMEASFIRNGGDVQKTIAELNLTGVSTDNVMDGMWCIWIAQNQERVLKDPKLAKMIRVATEFEDFTMFGSSYVNKRGEPGIELQAALIFHFNDVIQQHGIKGTDRFMPQNAEVVINKSLRIIDDMLANPKVRRESAHAFWDQLDTATRRSAEQVYQPDVSIDGRIAFFDATKFGDTPTLTQWLAIPMSHDLGLQVTAAPMPPLTKPDGTVIPRSLFITAIPDGRVLPSGKGLLSVLSAVNAAEKSKAEQLGIPPNFWFGKDNVILPAPFNGGSVLTSQELMSILNDPVHGLFEVSGLTNDSDLSAVALSADKVSEYNLEVYAVLDEMNVPMADGLRILNSGQAGSDVIIGLSSRDYEMLRSTWTQDSPMTIYEFSQDYAFGFTHKGKRVIITNTESEIFQSKSIPSELTEMMGSNNLLTGDARSAAHDMKYDDVVRGAISELATQRPGFEGELYYDPVTAKFIVIEGQAEGHLGKVVSVMDSGGNITLLETDQAQIDPEGLILIGDIHPAASEFGPIPSVDDVVRFFQEHERNPEVIRERVTLHAPDADSDPSWVRVYIDVNGDVQYQMSPDWDSPEIHAILDANIEQAKLQMEQGVDGLRRQSSNDLRFISKFDTQWWKLSGDPILESAMVWTGMNNLGSMYEGIWKNVGGRIVNTISPMPQKVGRDFPVNGMNLQGGDVSRQHIQVVQRDGQLFIQDLASSNGTRIYILKNKYIDLIDGRATEYTVQSDGSTKMRDVTSEDGWYRVAQGEVVVMGRSAAFVVPKPTEFMMEERARFEAEKNVRNAVLWEPVYEARDHSTDRLPTADFPETDQAGFGIDSEWWAHSDNATIAAAFVWHELYDINGSRHYGRRYAQPNSWLSSPSISESHFIIKSNQGDYAIRDDNSKLGTTIYIDPKAHVTILKGKATLHQVQPDGSVVQSDVTRPDGYYTLKPGNVVKVGDKAFVVPRSDYRGVPVTDVVIEPMSETMSAVLPWDQIDSSATAAAAAMQGNKYWGGYDFYKEHMNETPVAAVEMSKGQTVMIEHKQEDGAKRALSPFDREYVKQMGERQEATLGISQPLEGWYRSELYSLPRNRNQVGRIYFSLNPKKAVAFWDALASVQQDLAEQGIKFNFKVARSKTHLERADSAVLYFDARDQDAILAAIDRLYASEVQIAQQAAQNPKVEYDDVFMFKENVPPMTARILTPDGQEQMRGITFGQEPAAAHGESFGGYRSQVLNVAVNRIAKYAARGQVLSQEQKQSIIIQTFREYGIDPDQPAFNFSDAVSGTQTFDGIYARTPEGWIPPETAAVESSDIRRADLDSLIEQERVNPPLGSTDTVMFEIGSGKAKSMHNPNADAEFIANSEIIDMQYPPSTHLQKKGGVPYTVTPDGRHVIQQQGQRGCVAACAAMIAMDNGVKPDMSWVKSCNLSNKDVAKGVLSRAGLESEIFISTGDKKKIAATLETRIQQYGSGILGVGGEIGGHVVVVDYFSASENVAVIRDPFHGWLITMSADSLLERIGSRLEILQPKAAAAQQYAPRFQSRFNDHIQPLAAQSTEQDSGLREEVNSNVPDPRAGLPDASVTEYSPASPVDQIAGELNVYVRSLSFTHPDVMAIKVGDQIPFPPQMRDHKVRTVEVVKIDHRSGLLEVYDFDANETLTYSTKDLVKAVILQKGIQIQQRLSDPSITYDQRKTIIDSIQLNLRVAVSTFEGEGTASLYSRTLSAMPAFNSLLEPLRAYSNETIFYRTVEQSHWDQPNSHGETYWTANYDDIAAYVESGRVVLSTTFGELINLGLVHTDGINAGRGRGSAVIVDHPVDSRFTESARVFDEVTQTWIEGTEYLGMQAHRSLPPGVANDKARILHLMRDPDFRRRLETNGEYEIYYDEVNREYHYVSANSGRTDMGSVELAMSEEGDIESELPTNLAMSPNRGWLFVGDIHPSGTTYTIVPSKDDILRFMQEGVSERFTFRQDARSGDLTWSRIYRDDKGVVRIEFSEKSMQTPENERQFLRSFAQAKSEYDGNVPLRASSSAESEMAWEREDTESFSISAESSRPKRVTHETRPDLGQFDFRGVQDEVTEVKIEEPVEFTMDDVTESSSSAAMTDVTESHPRMSLEQQALMDGETELVSLDVHAERVRHITTVSGLYRFMEMTADRMGSSAFKLSDVPLYEQIIDDVLNQIIVIASTNDAVTSQQIQMLEREQRGLQEILRSEVLRHSNNSPAAQQEEWQDDIDLAPYLEEEAASLSVSEPEPTGKAQNSQQALQHGLERETIVPLRRLVEVLRGFQEINLVQFGDYYTQLSAFKESITVYERRGLDVYEARVVWEDAMVAFERAGQMFLDHSLKYDGRELNFDASDAEVVQHNPEQIVVRSENTERGMPRVVSGRISTELEQAQSELQSIEDQFWIMTENGFAVDQEILLSQLGDGLMKLQSAIDDLEIKVTQYAERYADFDVKSAREYLDILNQKHSKLVVRYNNFEIFEMPVYSELQPIFDSARSGNLRQKDVRRLEADLSLVFARIDLVEKRYAEALSLLKGADRMTEEQRDGFVSRFPEFESFLDAPQMAKFTAQEMVLHLRIAASEVRDMIYANQSV